MDAKTCTDINCPIHGHIKVRGKLLEGIVIKKKAQKTATIQIERITYNRKYERYLKKRTNYSVHCPECMGVIIGDVVLIGETRKISKTKSFVILKKVGTKKNISEILEKEDLEMPTIHKKNTGEEE
ncbi:MAG: 30S ribosomal protein S17 [Candidatus ainarchaeum sp.]|nr:30S ribosomal protein S17 [Candidatus ainarchaeum sp.]